MVILPSVYSSIALLLLHSVISFLPYRTEQKNPSTSLLFPSLLPSHSFLHLSPSFPFQPQSQFMSVHFFFFSPPSHSFLLSFPVFPPLNFSTISLPHITLHSPSPFLFLPHILASHLALYPPSFPSICVPSFPPSYLPVYPTSLCFLLHVSYSFPRPRLGAVSVMNEAGRELLTGTKPFH